MSWGTDVLDSPTETQKMGENIYNIGNIEDDEKDT